MIKSPCINVCEFDSKSVLCEECNCTGFEMFNWTNFSDEEKKLVLLKLKNRSIYSDLKISSHKTFG